MTAATMTVEATGAYLRQQAATKGYGTAQAGSLFAHVTRHGCEWALELCDETEIDGDTVDAWDAVIDAPADAVWRSEAHGRVWRCEWTGTEEPAPAGTKATWQGGHA